MPTEREVWDWLATVPDPEIPVLSIIDLGIVRDVHVDGDVSVSITPTYSGCPATEVIRASVVRKLREEGIESPRIDEVLSPPWTTDWITAAGRQKLHDFGIAPPAPRGDIRCPQCGSTKTEQVSEFGSTACKAAFRCTACLEPFEYFKCL